MFDPDRFFPPRLLKALRPTKRSYGRLLNLSNNELRSPQLNAVIASFYATSDVSWVTRYPYWPSVVKAVAKKFELPDERVWISAGADQAIRNLVRLAGMAGHRMILQWPNYATYATAAVTEGVTVERVLSVRCSEGAELEALCLAARRPGPACHRYA